MDYNAEAYHGNQDANAYYYYGEHQQGVGEGDYTIDLRPRDMTERQDSIIQLVAKYVVASCDGARYQHNLIKKTKFNPYFAFLASPQHKYHEYYQYLIRSYTHWQYVAAASAAGDAQYNDGYAFYTEQLQQQEQQWQQQYYEANMYAAQPSNMATASGEPPTVSTETMPYGTHYDANSSFSFTALQQYGLPSAQASVEGGGAVCAEEENMRRGRSATPQDSSDDGDEDKGMDFVMENGVARAVPRQ
ncbi:putative Surp module [Trypanosoma vivax]|uniref:Putative pre-mRNA splicing factor n=1 Tax=Trypanosoma vivax (strain Y486) TaxID=1055687 RepID=G0U4X0_TRYVY|nr:putative pre-mRNA splicing factor [Trypanosoma vivax]KAH8611345.1 putative Surp module [Trypanosoma vivax]CCC52485.1 putative pre-mRNA splicing factor [Trypanosoma vivax Y486]